MTDLNVVERVEAWPDRLGPRGPVHLGTGGAGQGLLKLPFHTERGQTGTPWGASGEPVLSVRSDDGDAGSPRSSPSCRALGLETSWS